MLLVISGCIGEKTPATTAPPTPKPTTFSQEILEEQVRLLLMNLAYEEEASRSVASEVVGWTDEQGNPVIGTRKGGLIDTRERYKEGNITIDELTDKEIWIALELGRKIKEEVPDYNIDRWHLENVIKEGRANCVGYAQLFYVLGKTVGLSVEPIEVVESRDLMEAHVTDIIGLSDGRKVMMELTSSSAYVSQAFTLEEEYGEAGNYLELLDDDSKLPHTRIRALDKDGLMAPVFISRAKNYDSSGEYLRAIAEINVAIGLDQGYALAYNNRGVAYRHLGYLYNALSDLDIAIELDPDFAEAYSNRGVVYAEFGNYTLAISNYDMAIELGSESAATYYNRGSAYADLKSYDSAISDYNRAIELDTEYAKAYYGIGDAYNYLGDYDSAMSDYTRAIELDPELAEAYGNRGTIYANRGEYPSAISDYTRAIELNPNVSATYYNRGNAHYNLKEYSEAISDYDRAIQMDLGFAEAYNNRGNAYLKQGESQKAQSDFDMAAELDPRFER